MAIERKATNARDQGVLQSLRRFAPHLAGKRSALVALFLLSLGGAAVSLATPLLGKTFVDAVASRGEFAIIPAIAAALVGLAVLDLALATVSQRVHARLSADVLASLRARLFARCTAGPLDAIEPFRHGDLLTRFGSDVPRIQTLLVDSLLGAIQSVLFLAVAAAITFTLSPALALWSFLGVALALAATAAFRRAVEQRTGRVREAMADLSHFFSERLNALRAIRMHRTQDEEQARLAVANECLKREVVGFQMLDAVATGAPALLLTLAMAWIYVVGGRLLEAGTISLGTFVAFVLYQARLFGPAQGLLALVRDVQAARVSLERVSEVLGPGEFDSRSATQCASNAVATASSAPPENDAMRLCDVTFAYAGKAPVFAGVNLCVRRGERVGLFGASGAGKTTLVQLLFGLRRPTTGTVQIGGRSAHEIGSTESRGVLGYAGAEPFLLHASVEENLRYGNPHASRTELERAARLAEADTFIAALPAGYATVIGGRGLALSDGQRQRLGLARLVLRDPRILILDEAFSGLDLETEARVRANLWRAFADRTVLIVSHRPVGLAELDRIVLVRGGRLTTVAPERARALLDADRTWDERVATALT
jgi:ABC-type multidrug transport system fused ATPase/permease subunit